MFAAGDFKAALYEYEKVVKLCPQGFFTAITAAHSLAKESRHEIPAGTYLKYLSIEWANNKDQKIKIVDELLNKVPNFAPALKEKAYFEEDDKKRLSLLEKGLAASPDAETKGFLLMNKALVIHRKAQKEKAIEILGNLILDPNSPLDVVLLAKKSLASLI